ncbi:Uncharacterised protein [Bordetella pertussis]|nr:Uncharacterised protein [Bordetella pertussis]
MRGTRLRTLPLASEARGKPCSRRSLLRSLASSASLTASDRSPARSASGSVLPPAPPHSSSGTPRWRACRIMAILAAAWSVQSTIAA